MTVIFAGGGSGGHISPGLAIAERLMELAPQSKAIFVCSQRAIDAAMLRDAGADFVTIPAIPPSLNPVGGARFLKNFLISKRIATSLIRERSVNQVVTLGGFVAAPAVGAAKAMGIPVMLINLDAPPGKANLWMAKRCDQVISAVALLTNPTFASRVVGMPIRRRALAPAGAVSCRLRLGLSAHKSTLLITGASQGAASINELMIGIAGSMPDVFNGWQVFHLSGQGTDEQVRRAYARAGIDAVVEPFLNEIGLAWGAADLAISRAGASSVAEAAHNAVPTLFMPYPYHKDMHQVHNAQPLVDLGGALVQRDLIDARANSRAAMPVLRELMRDEARRSTMRRILQSHPFPDAARAIAQILIQPSHAG